MKLATRHLEAQGYKVKDVSARESYDLLATDESGDSIYVEVKGTTAGPSSVFLTAAEVELHRRHYPHNALIVAHGIELDRKTEPPIASCGTLMVCSPWEIDANQLTPISFQYRLPVR